MPMWFQLLVLVCALSLVVCFDVQAASAQKGMLIKLKPCIVITDNCSELLILSIYTKAIYNASKILGWCASTLHVKEVNMMMLPFNTMD